MQMDLEESWRRAADLLIASHDVWESPELVAAFPDGLERAASALVATIGVDDVVWVETRAVLESPKVEAAVFSETLVAHLMLTAEGFGFDVHKLVIESLRATSIPHVHTGPDGAVPFTFTGRFKDLEVAFPWDADNTKQLDRNAGQFVWLRDKL
jgi:hypothetical protein